MRRRRLSVTAATTLDHVEARAAGDGWFEEAVAVLDVESPADREGVRLGFELDPVALARVRPHADLASLTPDQARRLAADLERVADAAERGDDVTSGRR